MNILSLGGNYKPGNNGNAKRISTMCEEFVHQGHNVTVCTCSEYKTSPKTEIINGVKVIRFEDFNEIVRKINNTISENNADVMLVHEETYLRKLRFKKLNIPVVYECHALEPNPNKYKELIIKALRKIYFSKNFVKHIFVLSKNAVTEAGKSFGRSVDCIHYTPNGRDEYKSSGELCYGERDDFIFGYAGTLYEFQGINILLKYAKDILAIADDVKIMIVGGGKLWDKVQSFVADNNLSDRIILTGTVGQEEFDRYIDKFDVMMMPRPSTRSTESAVPLKIFDAAKHKKPVVMSNVKGLTEAFGDDAALIYDTKQEKDFVECCKKLYRNRTLAESLVDGEIKALEAWPTVSDVAKVQLDAMIKVIS